MARKKLKICEKFLKRTKKDTKITAGIKKVINETRMVFRPSMPTSILSPFSKNSPQLSMAISLSTRIDPPGTFEGGVLSTLPQKGED